MRITKRQLRAIIKEELDLVTEVWDQSTDDIDYSDDSYVRHVPKFARELAPEIKEMVYRGFGVSDTTPEGEREFEDNIAQLILNWHRNFNRGAYVGSRKGESPKE